MNSEDNILLHLPLNKLNPSPKTNPASNDAVAPKDTNAPKDPQIVPDDHFGGCMCFDGNSNYTIDLASIDGTNCKSEELTLCAWIYAASLESSPQSVVIIDTNDGIKKKSLQCVIRGEKIYLGFNDGKTIESTEEIQANNWYHLALSSNNSNKKMSFYINGRFIGDIDGAITLQDIKEISMGGSDGSYFFGKTANLRVYKKDLSASEINNIMSMDQGAQTAFKLTCPIDFKLTNNEGTNILYISDDTKSQTLRFELTNSSKQDIKIIKPDENTSSYNFMLEFKPNTFEQYTVASKDCYVQLKNLSENWDSKTERDPNTGSILVYFTSKHNIQLLKAGTMLPFELEYASAGKNGGARGTTAQLQYQQIAYANNDPGNITMMKGTRITNIDIVNQRGKKNIPLYAGFTGANTILNDGTTENELILCIANISNESTVSLNPSSSATPSKFIIPFEVGTHELALCSLEQGKDIKAAIVKLKDGKWVDDNEWDIIPPSLQNNSLQWAVTSRTKQSLCPDDMLHVKFSKIRTNNPCGSTVVNIQYQNIPGYWDGTFIVLAQKMPLVYQDKGVGIGTAKPMSALHVAGSGLILSSKGDRGAASTDLPVNTFKIGANENGSYGAAIQAVQPKGNGSNGVRLDLCTQKGSNAEELTPRLSIMPFDGKVGIGNAVPRANLDVTEHISDKKLGVVFGRLPEGNEQGEGTFLGVRGYNSQQNQYDGKSFSIEHSFYGKPNSSINFFRGSSAQGGFVTFNTNSDTERMRITSDGKVGIGKTNPTEALEVNGRIKDQTGYVVPVGSILAYGGEVAPDGWLLCDGRQIPTSDSTFDELRRVIGRNTTPNLCLRTIIGAGKNSGVCGEEIRIHNTGGEWRHTLSVDEMPPHTHRYHGPFDNYGHKDGNTDWTRYGNQNPSHNGSTEVVGKGLAHENMPPYYTLSYIIKF